MKRKTCAGCAQPEATCLCDYLGQTNHKTKVWIIQCDKETKSAKNTANLLPKLSSHIYLIQDTDIEAMTALKNKFLNRQPQVAILFPTPEANSINHCKNTAPKLLPSDLILIDGTWRKAKRFILENDWLNHFQKLKLSAAYPSGYHIRKTSIENGLSTLEAVAYALYELESIDTAPFLHLLNGINTVFIKHMPDNVRHRY